MATNLPKKKVSQSITRDPRIRLQQQLHTTKRLPEASSPPGVTDYQLPDASASPDPNILTTNPPLKPTKTNDANFGASSCKTNQNKNQESERHFPLIPLNSIEVMAQIEEIKRRVKDFPLADCRDKVDWLSTIIQQQQLDLNLYRASSLAVERSTFLSLKQLAKVNRNYSIIIGEKTGLSEQIKEYKKGKNELEAENKQLFKVNGDLQNEIQNLTSFKTKYELLEKEAEKLKQEKENFLRQIDQTVAEQEKLKKFAELKKKTQVLAENQKDELKKKVDEMQKEEIRMKQRICELEQKLAMEKKLIKSSNMDKDADGSIISLKQVKKHLEAKKSELDNALKELKEKKEESEKWNHKTMVLCEKLTRRKDELQTAREEARMLKESLVEEQLRRDRFEQEFAKLEKEFLKTNDRNKNTSLTVPTIQQFPTEQVATRLNELRIKKEQLDKLITEIQSKRCESCQLLQTEIAKIREENAKIRQQNEKLIAAVKSQQKLITASIRPSTPRPQVQNAPQPTSQNVEIIKLLNKQQTPQQQQHPVTSTTSQVQTALQPTPLNENQQQVNSQTALQSTQHQLVAATITSTPQAQIIAQPTPRHAAVASVSHQKANPQSIQQLNQHQIIAARIVTNFMIFIGQNVNRDTRSLIPEFLQHYGLPSNHLIAEKLVAIANEAEIAKNKPTGSTTSKK